jgi:hypothetical protein
MQQLPQERLTIAVGGAAMIKLDTGASPVAQSPEKLFPKCELFQPIS